MNPSRDLKESFITGLVILAPLIVTIVVFRIAFGWVFSLMAPVFQNVWLMNYLGLDVIAAQVLAALSIPIAIIIVGIIAKSRAGRKTLGEAGKAVNLIPLFRTVYFSVKHVASSMTQKSRYKRVVAIEYPRKGVYSIGFVTATGTNKIELGKDMVNIFLPNSPNPTGGKYIIAGEDELKDLDISVREGLKMVMTAGLHAEEELPQIITEGENDREEEKS